MKTITTILAILFTTVGAYAQTGKIYFIAKEYAGNAFIDTKMTCHVNRKQYSIHDVAPGKHQVDIQAGGTQYKANDEPFYISVEAGKSYYVRISMTRGFMTADLICEEITENTAMVLMKDMKQDTDCFK